MPTTAGRSRGRQGVRSGAQGAVGEHLPKIMTALITGLVVIAFALVMTKPGQDIDAATQHFMLFYAGVFALIGLTALVGVGLVATDRIVMTPGHRVMAQAVHRAVSFGALAFLVIHIVTEILAQRAHVIDAFIPFLSPYRTFYIGLGTIASDLILLIIVTSIWRKRFTSRGKAWRWRAIHYTSSWRSCSGSCTGCWGPRGQAVRGLELRIRDRADRAGRGGQVPGHLAALQGQGDRASRRGPGVRRAGLLGDLAAAVRRAEHGSGPAERDHPDAAHRGGSAGIRPRPAGQPGLGRAAACARLGRILGPPPALPAGAGYAADPSLMPLGAPVYGESATAGTGSYPYPAAPGRQPLYEPEYDGPPRFQGAPRKHVPQDDLSSYPYAAQGRPPGWGNGGSGPLPLSPPPRLGSGPTPRAETSPMPRADSGPMPRLGSGPMPIPGTCPMPRTDPGSMPRLGSGPMPMPGSGSMPRTSPAPCSAPRVRLHARDRLRPDAPPRVRPDAPDRLRPDAPPRVRPDAPDRLRPDAAPRVRSNADAWERLDAPRRLRPDAPPRVGSDADAWERLDAPRRFR